MKNLLVALSILSVLPFASCEKAEGCTDPSSLNYNEDARLDDGSCLYIADTYVGSYAVTDTMSDLDTTQIRNYTFDIVKINRGAVTLNSFHNNTCSPRANVTMSEMLLESGRSECGITNFVGAFDDGILRFTYTADTLNPSFVTGTATWQE